MPSKIKNKDILFAEVTKLIEESKSFVAQTVNATITILYWKIGKKITEEILNNKRAEYGKQIITSLSQQLTEQYGSGWSEQQIRHCLRTVETFQDIEILSTLCRELSWSHIRVLMYVNDPLKREFYIEICRMERWSVRLLTERINSMLYERTAISKKPEQTIKNELALLKGKKEITPDLVFRDPYILDFLGLKDTYSEKDLESAILAEMQRFIIELGSDFAFLARQKRIQIDNKDFSIDLLFYHRRLKRLVAIDLKLGQFEAGFKGQMELYLRWLEKHEMQKGENKPIGLILCAEGNKEQIELLQLSKAGIKLAEYLTELPTKKLLQQKLHQAIEISKKRLENM
jgi:predicted nuclease of restriction endonuclease-like (RecB) superfamily